MALVPKQTVPGHVHKVLCSPLLITSTEQNKRLSYGLQALLVQVLAPLVEFIQFLHWRK
jgi:hypothetical protein